MCIAFTFSNLDKNKQQKPYTFHSHSSDGDGDAMTGFKTGGRDQSGLESHSTPHNLPKSSSPHAAYLMLFKAIIVPLDRKNFVNKR